MPPDSHTTLVWLIRRNVRMSPTCIEAPRGSPKPNGAPIKMGRSSTNDAVRTESLVSTRVYATTLVPVIVELFSGLAAAQRVEMLDSVQSGGDRGIDTTSNAQYSNGDRKRK